MRVSPVPPLTAGANPPHPPHSPHMSPAVGGPGSVVMPPHPGSGQSDSRPGNMHAPGYPPTAPPHMPSGPPPGPHSYPAKMGHVPPGGPPGPSYGQASGYQAGHQYPPVRPQGPMMQPYPQNFPPGGPQTSQGPPSSMPPSHQYPPRPPHNNHVPPSQPYGYPPFGTQGWGAQGLNQGPPGPSMPSSMMTGGPGISGKGGSVQMTGQVGQPGAGGVGGPRPHTPPHTSHYIHKHPIHKIGSYMGPQMYPNGPGMSGMPGMPNSSRESPQNNMPPPTSTPQPLTPSNTPLDSGEHGGVNNTPNPPSIGPDGNPLVDEASQQSTVSNNSAASGEDRSGTPKPHKDGGMGSGPPGGPLSGILGGGPPGGGPPGGGPPGGGPPGGGGSQHPPSHPPTPSNSAPSPGAASMNSQQDEFETVNSPGWPRSPSTQTPGENLARLYEMSDSPERRAWLDKLLSFMDENKTPITACPTISKNPLDLYALYLHVRERGGFVEVTKNKQWKDVAAVMGIGASSSGSYTLRKHYMKHILTYECKYDRGGVDPQPIVNQIEAAAKKKTTKTISVPSPGSSNSQDSFPAAGSNSSSMDGFSNGPHVGAGSGGVPGPYPQYPPSSEYPGHIPHRPPSQSTSAGYQGYQGGQYYQGMQGGYGQGAYPNSSYPPPDGRGYPPQGPPNHQSSYQANYQQPGSYQRPAYPPGQPGFQQDQYPMGSSGTTNYGNSQLAKQLLNPPRSSAPMYQGFQGGSMYPPGQKSGSAPSPGPAPPSVPAGYSGPRRHPDFEKNQPPGWPRPNSQFPSYTGPGQPPQQPWSRPNDTAPPGAPAAQWSQPRFPGAQPQYPGAGRGWSGGSYTQNVGPRSQAPGSNKNYLVPPPSAFKCGTGLYGAFGKQQFPHDSVEAVLPVLARRKRMTRSDLQTCDPWRLLMSLRCGLAAEVTWALDVLNILLFDDQTVVYFGLQHLPGLLEALVEHLRRGLINMFDICSELELGRDDEATGANKRVKAEQHDSSDRPWYLRPPPSPTLDLDLGRLDDNDPANKEEVLRNGPDFTLVTKTGKSVKFVRREGELFLREGVREWDKWEGFSSGVDTWSVGGGECTAHIICNMQSSVPPLVFTRLLPGRDGMTKDAALLEEVKEEEMVVEVKKEKEEEEEKEEKPKVMLMEEKKKVVEMVEVKEEHVKKDRVGELLAEMKEKKMVDLISREKCDNSKDNESSNKLFSQRVNKVNNMRRSKLDEIFKKLKKEPIEDISDNKNSAKETKDVSCVVKKEIEMQDCSTATVKQEPSSDKIEESEVEQEGAGGKLVFPPPPVPRQDRLERRESGGSRRESSGFKRPHEDLEEESWGPDEASLSTTTEGQDWLARRVICVGTVIRNLSFIPGNEDIMSKSASLLALLGKTILLHHQHPHRTPSTAHYDRDEEADLSDWCSSLAPDTHWWWPYLHHVHENTLVTLANMAGNLDLSVYPEEISRPLLNGLLHWATCPASYGQDPFPTGSTTIQSVLSPQRLALEALVKLCVLDQNTDLVLATPPFNRLDNLCGQLTRLMCRGEDQVLREFSINLLHYFSAADSGVARVIAMQNGCVSLLVAFIEEAEAAAMNVANVQGVSALKENPELMGTSLDMVRRSANTLVHLSRVPANARVITSTENRLLTLVMSQILDTYVASQLSQVLFNVANVQIDISQYSSHSTPPVPKSQLAATAQAAATAAIAVAAAAVVPAAAAAAAAAAATTTTTTAAAAAAAAAVEETPAVTVTAAATTLSANPDETLNAKSPQQPDVPSSQSSPTAAITNHVSATCDSVKLSAASSPSTSPPAAATITSTPATTPSSNLTTTTANATAAPTTITTLTSLPNTTTTLTLGKIPPTTNSIPTPTPSLAPAPPPSILASIPAPATTPIFAPQLSLSVKPTSTLTGPPHQAATSPDMTPKCEPLAQAPAPAPAPMPMEAPAANSSS